MGNKDLETVGNDVFTTGIDDSNGYDSSPISKVTGTKRVNKTNTSGLGLLKLPTIDVKAKYTYPQLSSDQSLDSSNEHFLLPFIPQKQRAKSQRELNRGESEFIKKRLRSTKSESELWMEGNKLTNQGYQFAGNDWELNPLNTKWSPAILESRTKNKHSKSIEKTRSQTFTNNTTNFPVNNSIDSLVHPKMDLITPRINHNTVLPSITPHICVQSETNSDKSLPPLERERAISWNITRSRHEKSDINGNSEETNVVGQNKNIGDEDSFTKCQEWLCRCGTPEEIVDDI